MSWLDQAACKGADPKIFFPGVTRGGVDPYADARKVCASCPVKQDCLARELAIAGGSRDMQYGMFGGTSPRERHRLGRVSQMDWCDQCDRPYERTHDNRRYCSPVCRNRAWRARASAA